MLKAITTFSSIGNRPAQEDAFLVNQNKKIMIVADGFGGPVSGKNASKLATESIQSFLFKEVGDQDATLPFIIRSYFSLAANVLFNSFIFSNTQLMKANKAKNVHEKGGASVISAFIDEDLLVLGNIGTCQSYLLRGTECKSLTYPRTFSRLNNPFLDDPDPNFEVPMMALGLTESIEPEIYEYKILENDLLILCTDGVTKKVLNEIHRLFVSQTSRLELDQLIKDLVESNSYSDNATLSLCWF